MDNRGDNIAPTPKSVRRTRKPRKTFSCDPCRTSKLQCDREIPCAKCIRRGTEASCTYRSTRRDASSDTTPVQGVSVPSRSTTLERPNRNSFTPTLPPHDIPNGEVDEPTLRSCESLLQRPEYPMQGNTTSSISGLLHLSSSSSIAAASLVEDLPPREFCDYLVTAFFTHISPLFDVVHGPTFQKQYAQFMQDPTAVHLSWLALLYVICASALNTVEDNDPALTSFRATQKDCHQVDTLSLSRKLLDTAFTCLSQDRFFFNHDLSTLEALLLAVYVICHSEGVERGWVLLGTALNIGIALRCNTISKRGSVGDSERHRRCWAGILMLHTYQGIVFRDIDMSYLLNIDFSIREETDNMNFGDRRSTPLPKGPEFASLMQYKLRLFALSSRICNHTWDLEQTCDDQIEVFNAAIAAEQQQWDANYLINGAPSILGTASYAHWCILQTYAHQLYLLVHRPFYRSRSNSFRTQSRNIYLESSMSLMDLHRQLCEVPRLRNYRWLAKGMTSFNAFQGAVALASCLLDQHNDVQQIRYKNTFDATVARFENLQALSPVCAKTYPVLRNLQYVFPHLLYFEANGHRSHLAEHIESTESAPVAVDPFEQWIEQVNLLETGSQDWVSYHYMMFSCASADAGNFANETAAARQFLRLSPARCVGRKM